MMTTQSLIGESPAIRRLNDEIDAAARCDAKVLITGESGSGKEVAARLVHTRSARRSGPFLAINCAAIAESLLESELFGHVRGSFTGAFRDRTGLLETAHRGTLLMDEIGEMTLRMQRLLLRFLETGEIQRVGDDRPSLGRDVRVIAATNTNLVDGIAAHAFRRDLYYRLNVISITVPPLRERRDDVPLLARAFLDAACAANRVARPEVTPAALLRLVEYDWPGNVRELRNVVERLVVRLGGRPIEVGDLPLEVASPARAPEPAGAGSACPRTADTLFDRMVSGRQSFWSAVYDPFMSHDLTRDDVMQLVRRGLERTRGSVPHLLQLFNLELADLDRFLSFLRKHQCLLPQHRTALRDGLGRREPDRSRRGDGLSGAV